MLTDHDGGRGENGAELAGGERVQGAQAGFEFGRGYAALVAEAAKKIFGVRLSLLRVAFDAAGNQIAVGIRSSTRLWNDMVEAALAGRELAQAIKAEPPVTLMNGLPAGFPLLEIHLLEAGAAGPPREAGGHRDLARRVLYLLR